MNLAKGFFNRPISRRFKLQKQAVSLTMKLHTEMWNSGWPNTLPSAFRWNVNMCEEGAWDFPLRNVVFKQTSLQPKSQLPHGAMREWTMESTKQINSTKQFQLMIWQHASLTQASRAVLRFKKKTLFTFEIQYVLIRVMRGCQISVQKSYDIITNCFTNFNVGLVYANCALLYVEIKTICWSIGTAFLLAYTH